jgi:hypothetical protein
MIMSERNSGRRKPMQCIDGWERRMFQKVAVCFGEIGKMVWRETWRKTKSPASGGKQGGVKSLIDAALGCFRPDPASRCRHAFGGMPTFARMRACTCLGHRLLEALDISGKCAAGNHGVHRERA